MNSIYNLDGDFVVKSNSCTYTPEAIVADYVYVSLNSNNLVFEVFLRQVFWIFDSLDFDVVLTRLAAIV
jgi:hypothetical protein